ncbi:alkaline phosphatase [Olivibacter domesticus]|uniref:Type I phosphodiesterase / nucleotide pyrophosphatase n=1 Tax=Olivibacter domesticus TaxID=407022 RepID=A0A1H7M8D3_OLID1|nr:alkaline phosphatase [Olivibacter domesticus]SEL06995.1 Type I phosphodiesterase / nucleotide pyrophosphatase [Olivibacter domesticus]
MVQIREYLNIVSKRKLLYTLFLLAIALPINAQVSKAKHIVLIGCDGFGAYALPEADMPNLKKLMETGAWSLKARSVLPSSSAVNWASMLMGASPTLHGYTEWGSKTPEIPSADTTTYKLFPSIFSVIRQQKKQSVTAAVYSWPGIGHLIEKDAITKVIPTNDNEDLCLKEAVKVIQEEKPLFTFIHFDEPDHTGHEIGHRTPAYYTKLKEVDQRIGEIVNAVKAAGIADETIIILSADHGGKDKGHGGKSLDEVQIPWVINGVGIKKGHEIKDVIITYDTAATIAWILGLDTPQSWRGKAVLSAFGMK